MAGAPRVSSVPPDLRPQTPIKLGPKIIAPKAKPAGKPAKIGLPDAPWQVGLGPKPKPAAKPAGPAAPKPLTDLQLAQQQIDPILASITGNINQQTKAAADSVRGYTTSLAQQLAGMNLGAPYDKAIPQQAGIDAALQQSLTGKGSELAQGLASKLSGLNEPGAVDPAVAATQNLGASNGTTALANGSANLSALLADRASAQGYGAKLPGIAGLAGVQQLGQLQGQAVKDIADQTAPILGKLPDIVSGIQSGRLDQQKYQHQLQTDNATAAAQKQQLDLEHALTIWKTTGTLPAWASKVLGVPAGTKTADYKTTQAKIGQAGDKAKWQQAYDKRRADIAQQGADAATQRAQIADWKAHHPQPKSATVKASSSLSGKFGYLVDGAGNPILKNGKRQPLPASKGSGPSVSVQEWNAKALGGARHYHEPWKDKNGDTQKPLTWQQYLTAAESQGIPASIVIKQGRRIYSQAEIHQGLIPGGG